MFVELSCRGVNCSIMPQEREHYMLIAYIGSFSPNITIFLIFHSDDILQDVKILFHRKHIPTINQTILEKKLGVFHVGKLEKVIYMTQISKLSFVLLFPISA